MSDHARDAGYDDFLDAVEAGEPYYLESPSGNGWLPPREVDPETGEVLTYTITNVAGPSFADDTPYVVAIAEFGPVRITGQIRGMDHDDVEVGQTVELSVGRNETAEERVVVFEPV